MKHEPILSKYQAYYAAVSYLESLGNSTGGYQKTNLKAHPNPGIFLERMQDFLNLIGNPERGFKYVHVTGTAGKGSVTSLVQSTLVNAGNKVGLFTSPFTVSTTEKIQVGSKYIDFTSFANITESLKPHIDQSILKGRHGSPSYFELILAIALLYFRRERCDYVVLEVGLGGRYDATNVIESPIITAITNIGLDHTNILGPRLEDIARDKSGIIKKGSTFFTTEANKNLLRLFKEACAEKGAKYCPLKVDGLTYLERNSILAGSICTALGVIKRPEDISSIPPLPARFEIVERSPLIIIDGAHNPSKMETTVFNLKQLKYRRLILIIGISSDKDWLAMVRNITPYASAVYITRFTVPGRQGVELKLLFDAVRKYSTKSCTLKLYSDPIQAYSDARKQLDAEDALLVTGSFYLAGDIRALYCPEMTILRQRNSNITRSV